MIDVFPEDMFTMWTHEPEWVDGVGEIRMYRIGIGYLSTDPGFMNMIWGWDDKSPVAWFNDDHLLFSKYYYPKRHD